MYPDLVYQIALTQVPLVGAVHARILLQQFTPAEIFQSKPGLLEKMEGIGPARAASIARFRSFDVAEKELKFISRHGIQPIFITSDDYPKRLLHCYDAPIMLYYRGNAILNAARLVAIVGTRSCTTYAKQITDSLVDLLAQHDVTIISGLAYGVDAIAHRAAIRNSMPTIGVLAHGLDTIYPAPHQQLARQMISSGGGILTEFISGTKPDMHNFPSRNRIVAGMTDATIVVESPLKGGSLITADLAAGYHRDVFAVPGRTTDAKSAGCNELIKSNKAAIFTSPQDFLLTMGWTDQKPIVKQIQKNLFPELSSQEQIIFDLLKDGDSVHIDEINFKSGLSTGSVAAGILNLEMQNVILSLPGKLYQLA
jgi:DNA processing protein